MLPLILGLQINTTVPSAVIMAHLIVVGTLMASRIPTFSGKKARIKSEYIPPFMIVGSLLLALFIIEPWWFLIVVSVAYIGSIPLSIKAWRSYSSSTPANN